MKKRLTSLLVLCIMILSATSTLAYDWDQMRGEVDIRFQNKDGRGTDGTGGGTRAYNSQRAELKIMPFEDSEFYLGMGAEFRDYTDNDDSRKGSDRQTYDFFVGNTYYTRIFGKTLTINPEVGYENNNRKGSEDSAQDRSDQKLYLDNKMNLSLNRQWTVFSKTKIEFKKMDYTGSGGSNSNEKSNSTWAPNTRLENGAKYRWNNTHTSSLAFFYRNSSTDANYWGYAKTEYQLRAKHHWKLAPNFTAIPYVHIDLGNSSRNDQDSEKDKAGTKFKWHVRDDLELYGGVAYETSHSKRNDEWNASYTKRFLVTHAGMRYAF